MKVVEKITTIFWDWILVYLKRKNKNLVVTKRLSAYVNNLSGHGISNEWLESYNNILKLPNGSYQTPISEIRNLQLFIGAKNAKKILEVGTFRGFTSMCLAAATTGSVTTCEINHENANEAKKLWAKYGFDKRINVIEGDASETMSNLVKKKSKFDFIYIDADKSRYESYLELADKLCDKGGLIVIDNALWAGLVAYPDSKYSHARIIDKLNQKVFKNNQYLCSMIPAWDGVVIIYKK